MIELRSSVLTVGITGHGARIARLAAPDRDGRAAQVVLGLDEYAYYSDRDYLGATVGRFANRIGDGRFVLDGVEYSVPCNEGTVALHGGKRALDHAEFTAEAPHAVDDGVALTLRHVSPDGDNGFPGRLDVRVTYTVSGPDLRVELLATTDAPTVVNLTNHAYFTLAGAPEPVGDLEATVFADRFLPVDDRLLPTGALAPVDGTPFDLREPTGLGARLEVSDPQLDVAGGFDHTWVLDGSGPHLADGVDEPLPAAAHVRHPASGRTLTVFTDQPGAQFYTGNFLDGTLALHDGGTARRREAFCVEPQHFPDSPNRPEFPTTVLRPGATYRARSVYRFGTSPA
ncbi:aldose epimerase family protein [Pseudonocardia humida]|uniref:Aldose 1-epimerase n=1 Tax=Pseudonocardia humida TaxID=2800819 RepID=A0ABT1AA20_9PSEU|nr:aldose epimerase family protein [Pseudonocardia humida]MCO1659796.1 galactose mutarotase [Pseudonocardia humida]